MDLTLARVLAMDLRYLLVSSVLRSGVRGVGLVVLGVARVGKYIMLPVGKLLALADRASDALVGVPPRRRKTAGIGTDEAGCLIGEVGVRGASPSRLLFELERGACACACAWSCLCFARLARAAPWSSSDVTERTEAARFGVVSTLSSAAFEFVRFKDFGVGIGEPVCTRNLDGCSAMDSILLNSWPWASLKRLTFIFGCAMRRPVAGRVSWASWPRMCSSL